MNLHICGLEEARQSTIPITHIISVIQPEWARHVPDLGLPAERRHLAVCHDIWGENLSGSGAWEIRPNRQLVSDILAFSSGLKSSDTLLIHCAYGISRSTAVGFAVLCQHNPHQSAEQLLRKVVRLRPIAHPNPLIVTHADDLLNRGRLMLKALDEYEEDPSAFMEKA